MPETTHTRRATHARKNHAYTLIELLVVIAIIGILSSLLLGGIMLLRGRGATTKVQALVNRMALALGSYESEIGDYPPGAGGVTSSESLYRCLASPKWTGQHDFAADEIMDTDGNGAKEVVDHWMQPIEYFHHRSYDGPPRTSTFRIISAGPDGEMGTSDDINNF